MKTALTEICSFLDSYGFNYGLIGGLAISIHGIPRFTADIDLLVEPTILKTEKIFYDYFSPDLIIQIEKPDLSDPLGEIIRLRLNMVQIDLIVAKTNLHFAALENTCRIEVMGKLVKIVTPEDLILLKLSAGGPRDLLDIGGILEVCETKLDWDYLERQIKTYRLEDEWTIAQKWTK